MKTKKQRKIMVLIILLLAVTIGFALLSTTLKINGTAGIKKNTWNIHWNRSSVSVASGSVEASDPVVGTTTATDDTVSFDVELELPGEYYEFEIDAINEGSIDGKIQLDENFIVYKSNGSIISLPDYMNFSVTYADNTTPQSGDVLKHGESKTYKIRVEIDEDADENDLANIPPEIKIEIKVSYIQHKEEACMAPTAVYSSTGTKQEGLLGVAYLDPRDLSASCNENNSLSYTGVTGGCMKWYIYDCDAETGTYKLLLDHNTSGDIRWSSSGNNYDTPDAINERLAEDTPGWLGNPRLITIEEVAGIVNATSFNKNNSTNYVFNTGTIQENNYTAMSKGASKYSWLFENTQNCEMYGCDREDNSTYPSGSKTSTEKEKIYGYWTSSYPSNESIVVWYVEFYGDMSLYDSYSRKRAGIRPVITLTKEQLNK